MRVLGYLESVFAICDFAQAKSGNVFIRIQLVLQTGDGGEGRGGGGGGTSSLRLRIN